ncbi:PepSY-associated TM helix domain-containing protein [Mucilaginibacter ginkgonis]|uniref:PepSY domain-containing protein n=1 Tax=Mucilaginibacter ginkgonis TaxID=2682091 RepID=A0A6I4I358_9SPHI|nr:PepSY-associated TM helix domain-containing protein [Mucilaginibacter ginkgonis]QQL49733.1 PepSY domain-containing protein [Mucilaginibacter ginkgonis]
MTRTKKSILFIHRWLGFITGLVVFIVSITGCIFCFQDEIQDAMHIYRKVEVQSKPFLPPSILKKKAIAMYPGSTATYIYYLANNRPAYVLVSSKKDGYMGVYFNPYTGQYTHTENYAKNLFIIVEYIHLYLLLPPKIGQMVVGVSVLIFVAIMITGIILWWPKRKSDRKRSFTIKWGGRWRRVNYDLHNVLGFYATSIAIVLAVTGLSISFQWVTKGINKAVNLGKDYPVESLFPVSDSLGKAKAVKHSVADSAFRYVQKRSPNGQMFLIADDESAAGTVSLTAYQKSMNFGCQDNYIFDRYNGKLLKYLPNAKKSPGLKLNDLNYDIHVGQVGGITTKIIAFLASLICASLPITGFIVWLGKRKKKPKGKALRHPVKAKITV